MKVILIRHGQTDHNIKRIYQGSLDVPLNDEGRTQAALCSQIVSRIPLDAVYSSDLSRCAETTNILLKNYPEKIPIYFTEKLRERFMGELQDCHIDDVKKLLTQTGKSSLDFGESKTDFNERIMKFWDTTVRKALKTNNKKILFVTHGGVITNIMANLVNSGDFKLSDDIPDNAIKVPTNTSISVVDVSCSGDELYGTIEVFGDASHLAQEFRQADQELR